MDLNLSKFGEKMAANSGINQLMDDLGEAMASGEMLMLGGGNPGQVPQVVDYMQKRMIELTNDDSQFHRIISNYAPPQGDIAFRQSLAKFFNNNYSWGLTEENIVLTSGSQSAFFLLFNAIAGRFSDGSFKKIMFPVTPEYIGYQDQGIDDDMFVPVPARIELLDDNFFKYRVDFDNLNVGDDVAALCVSRPTNPTGNVLTDSEIESLDALAKSKNIPLIIDNAYGVPFPGIIFTEAKPIWNENIILSMSLSKLGLPSTRTGIIIANEEYCSMLARCIAISNLAVSSVGAALCDDLVSSGEILNFANNYVKPFYQNKLNSALDHVNSEFGGLDYRIHKPEGSLFMWMWFPDLPISSVELYERLKKRGVLVIPGKNFLADGQHKDECIRVTYSQADDVVEQGIKLIAEEIKDLV